LRAHTDSIETLASATFKLLLPLRLFVSHYSYAATHVSGINDDAKEHRTIDKENTVIPEKKSKSPEIRLGPVLSNHSLQAIIEAAVFDSQAFAVEKFGAAPEVEIRVSDDNMGLTCLCVDAHVHYVCMELLKNSYRAMITKYGALEVKEAHPIVIFISCSENAAGISIEDSGGGMSIDSQRNAFRFFHTTAPPLVATYTYSRQFGAAFDGLVCICTIDISFISLDD